jgi:hypothetical protein
MDVMVKMVKMERMVKMDDVVEMVKMERMV